MSAADANYQLDDGKGGTTPGSIAEGDLRTPEHSRAWGGVGAPRRGIPIDEEYFRTGPPPDTRFVNNNQQEQGGYTGRVRNSPVSQQQRSTLIYGDPAGWPDLTQGETGHMGRVWNSPVSQEDDNYQHDGRTGHMGRVRNSPVSQEDDNYQHDGRTGHMGRVRNSPVSHGDDNDQQGDRTGHTGRVRNSPGSRQGSAANNQQEQGGYTGRVRNSPVPRQGSEANNQQGGHTGRVRNSPVPRQGSETNNQQGGRTGRVMNSPMPLDSPIDLDSWNEFDCHIGFDSPTEFHSSIGFDSQEEKDEFWASYPREGEPRRAPGSRKRDRVTTPPMPPTLQAIEEDEGFGSLSLDLDPTSESSTEEEPTYEPQLSDVPPPHPKFSPEWMNWQKKKHRALLANWATLDEEKESRGTTRATTPPLASADGNQALDHTSEGEDMDHKHGEETPGAEGHDLVDSGFKGHDQIGSGFKGHDQIGSGFKGHDQIDSGFKGHDQIDSGFKGHDQIGSGFKGHDQFDTDVQPDGDHLGDGEAQGDGEVWPDGDAQARGMSTARGRTDECGGHDVTEPLTLDSGEDDDIVTTSRFPIPTLPKHDDISDQLPYAEDEGNWKWAPRTDPPHPPATQQAPQARPEGSSRTSSTTSNWAWPTNLGQPPGPGKPHTEPLAHDLIENHLFTRACAQGACPQEYVFSTNPKDKVFVLLLRKRRRYYSSFTDKESFWEFYRHYPFKRCFYWINRSVQRDLEPTRIYLDVEWDSVDDHPDPTASATVTIIVRAFGTVSIGEREDQTVVENLSRPKSGGGFRNSFHIYPPGFYLHNGKGSLADHVTRRWETIAGHHLMTRPGGITILDRKVYTKNRLWRAHGSGKTESDPELPLPSKELFMRTRQGDLGEMRHLAQDLNPSSEPTTLTSRPRPPKPTKGRRQCTPGLEPHALTTTEGMGELKNNPTNHGIHGVSLDTINGWHQLVGISLVTKNSGEWFALPAGYLQHFAKKGACKAEWEGLITCYYPTTSTALIQGKLDVASKAQDSLRAFLGIENLGNDNGKRRKLGLQAAFELEDDNKDKEEERKNHGSVNQAYPDPAPPHRGGMGGN
jgi:hypothetical protein